MSGPIKISHIEFSFNSLFVFETGVLIGFLFLLFGVLIRLIGIKDGLLSEHSLMEKLTNSSILEMGGAAGLVIVTAGILITIHAVGQWGDLGFSSLPDMNLLRLVSLSSLMMIMGSMVFLFSLAIGFLSLPTRRTISNE